ncbi:MAG: tetratricopeptide repeat protein [Bacteroidales bacterium]|nr:tetratricopeptide repeat protein [Bacteroidales bacterium]
MKKLLFTVIAVLTAMAAYAQTDIKVEVHRVVSEGEQFNLTFIIEGENAPSDFSWSPSDEFQVLWGPQSGRSTSISIVNGKRTKSVQSTYTYVLRANSSGTYEIPAARATLKDKTISSAPVSVQVVANASSSSQSSSAQSSQSAQKQQSSSSARTDDIFLDMTVSNRNVVVGEPLIATLKLYQRVNVAGFEGVSFPSFDGFWSQELAAPTNIEFNRETYDGQIYNAALLRKFVLVPQQQGTLTIDPAELVCLVQIRVSSGGSSIFDGFFDDYRTVRQRVVSKPININVRPLPPGAPASFGGGVGEFSISARLSKDVLKTHEAASLTVTISGQGNVSLLAAPKVDFPPDMEVYDTKISDNIAKGGLSGSKVYEFPFIPRSHGDFTIEPIKYSYYDVTQKKYVTVQTEPLTITVEKSTESETSSPIISQVGKTGVKNIGSDIRFISIKDSSLSPSGVFFVGSLWFWLAVAGIIVLSALLWLVLRKIALRRADLVGTRTRKATRMAMKRLNLAHTFLKQNLYTAFYEELHKALVGFVSDKLNMPLAELSRDRIAETLNDKGVEKGYVDSYIGLLDACEYARYAPASGHEAMSAHYDAAVDVISSIDSEMKTNTKSKNQTALIVALLLCVPMAASAQNDSYVDSLWNSAAEAYSQGRWEDAVADYEQINAIGLESAALYCNTGNAYYKSGNIPMSILNYERALKLDPSYEDARYNLEYLGNMIQDQIDPVPDFILAVWMEKVCRIMDSDAWAVTFLVLLALTAAMVLLFLLAPSVAGRKTGFALGIVTLLLCVASLSFSLWQKNDYQNRDGAIVVRPVVSVKSSPSSEASQNLFVLHEGTKVYVLDQVGSWNNIELADGRQGWVRTSDIEVI